MNKTKKILKKTGMYAFPTIFAAGIVACIGFGIASSIKEENLQAEAKDLKENAYNEYILTDDFKSKQDQYIQSLNEMYTSGLISIDTYQTQLNRASTQDYALELLLNNDYANLKSDIQKANQLETEANELTPAPVYVIGAMGCAMGAGISIGLFAGTESNKKSKQEIAISNQLYDKHQKEQDELLERAGCKSPEVPANYQQFLK